MWDKISDLERAKGLILSGYPENKSFEPWRVPDHFWPTTVNTILDFGCGIGRSIPPLIERAPNAQIYGYDFENMTNLAKQYLGYDYWKRVIWINPPIENLRSLRPDIIIAIIVFQHIPEIELQGILRVLREIIENGVLFVQGRGYLDGQRKNVWKILLDYFDAQSEIDSEDGTERHQQAIFKRKA